MSPSFSSLQSLRGVFAIFIFFHHLGLFNAGGDSGVAFFIILSGFVMSAGYKERIIKQGISYKDYLKKRFRRIYPYHLIGFCVSLFIMNPFYGKMTPIVWTANLTMLQSWIPSETFYFSCDSPSWCLSDLFFCYAIFPFLCAAFSKTRKTILIATLLIIIYIPTATLMPESLLTPFLYINPGFRIIDFILGMTLWTLFCSDKYNKFRRRLSSLPGYGKTLLEIAAIALAICFYLFYPSIPNNYALVSWWWPPMLVITLLFSSLKNGGLLTRLLTLPAAVKFGNLSFAFYMIHLPIIAAYKLLAQHLGISPAMNIFSVPLIFLTTLYFAYICEKAVERLSRKI